MADNEWLTNLAWLAGIIDGEGCIALYTNHGYTYPDLQIGSTSRVIIEKIILTTNTSWERVYIKTLPSGKQFYNWRLHGWEPICEVLRSLLPYLSAKQEQAILVIQANNYRKVKDLPPLKLGNDLSVISDKVKRLKESA